MNIELIIKEKKQYLLVESKGTITTKEDLITHCKTIYELAEKHHCKKVLIYEPETHFPDDVTYYFDLVKNYVTTLSPQSRALKVAIVVAEEFKEIAGTWETLSVSRGFQFFAFTSAEEAKRWLLGENETVVVQSYYNKFR